MALVCERLENTQKRSGKGSERLDRKHRKTLVARVCKGLASGPEVLASGPEGLASGPEGLVSGPKVLASGPQHLASGPQGLASCPEG